MRKISPLVAIAALALATTAAFAQVVTPPRVVGPNPPKIAPSGPAYTTQNLNVVTATQLAQALVGPGITVANVSTAADNIAMGSYTNGFGLGIGIDQGIVLSSGDVQTAIGPNAADNFTTNLSTGSDPDLAVIATNTLFDSTVLQFDFTDPSIAPGQPGAVQFQFVFGSDEYNEFVNSGFNDVFAFFLNGSNIAVLPDLVTPVAINNVNCGNPFNPLSLGTFCDQFNNNDLSDGGPFFNTEMDGFTNVLTAFGNIVGPGPHTIKLAIADAGDSGFDSWVYLAGGSLQILTDPSCLPPTPDVDVVGQLLALYDVQTINHPVIAVSNSVTPGVPSAVSITGVNVTFTPDVGPPVSIGVPPGVTYSAPFPTPFSQPASVNFSWSPSSAVNPIGLYEFCYQFVDQAGLTGECCVVINVYECALLVGVQPMALQVTGDATDVLRVEPLWVLPMTLDNLPSLDIPNVPQLYGFKFYVQGLIQNAHVFPSNPLSLSRLLEYTIGVGATFASPVVGTNINVYPTGTGIVQPGQSYLQPFTVAGFGGF